MAKTIGELIKELWDTAALSEQGVDTPIQGYHDLGSVNVVVSAASGDVFIGEERS